MLTEEEKKILTLCDNSVVADLPAFAAKQIGISQEKAASVAQKLLDEGYLGVVHVPSHASGIYSYTSKVEKTDLDDSLRYQLDHGAKKHS